VVFVSHWSALGRWEGQGFGAHHIGGPGQRCSLAGAVPYLQGYLNRQTQPGLGLGLLLWCYTHHLARGRTQDRLGSVDTAADSLESRLGHRSRHKDLCLGKDHRQ
jgi:hypothetical protein